MGLRLRLLLVVMLPLGLVVGAYGIVRVQQETRDAIEAERRQAAIAASAVRIAVEYTLGTREIPDVQRLAAQLVTAHAEINRIVAVDRRLAPLASEPPGPLSRDQERELSAVLASGQPLERTDSPGTIRYVLPLRGRDDRVEGAMEIAILTQPH